MTLAKITPTHAAIATLNSTIKTLKLQRDALLATLPVIEDKKIKNKKHMIVHPLTKKKYYYETK
jgi:hypothetical protein